MLKSFLQVIEEETSLFDRVLPAIRLRNSRKTFIGKRGEWHDTVAANHDVPEGLRPDLASMRGAVRRGDLHKYYTKGFYDPLHKKYHHAWSPKVKGFDAADLTMARSKVAEFR